MPTVYNGLADLVKHMILLPAPSPTPHQDLVRAVDDAIDEATIALRGVAAMNNVTLSAYTARICACTTVDTFVARLGEHLRRER